jgi:hypothetical protein
MQLRGATTARHAEASHGPLLALSATANRTTADVPSPSSRSAERHASNVVDLRDFHEDKYVLAVTETTARSSGEAVHGFIAAVLVAASRPRRGELAETLAIVHEDYAPAFVIREISTENSAEEVPSTRWRNTTSRTPRRLRPEFR